MIQCWQCEDWFHNNHLNPPVFKANIHGKLKSPDPKDEINENTSDEKFSENVIECIPDEYILICRNCIKKQDENFEKILYRYLNTDFYKPIISPSKKFLNNQTEISEPNLKR